MSKYTSLTWKRVISTDDRDRELREVAKQEKTARKQKTIGPEIITIQLVHIMWNV